MSAGNNLIRRDRAPPPARSATMPRHGPPGVLARTTPPVVVLIESDRRIRATLSELLNDWGLRVIEADPDSATPVRDEHAAAAAIITDFELGADADRSPPFNGLDIALAIARRVRTCAIPILVTSDNFGRHAIPACSPHRIPVIFKPVAAEYLRGWLVHRRAADRSRRPGRATTRRCAPPPDPPGLPASAAR